jgi:adenylylsulfate kinase
MTWVIWITGLPGCGKTTIAQLVRDMLSERGINAKILQLDEIRQVITPHPTYKDDERDIVYASLAYMAKLLAESGTNVIVDATAYRRKYRDLARHLVPEFAEVYVNAPLEVCMERESARKAGFAPTKIYNKAQKEDATVPGANVIYEEPLAPDVIVDSYAMDALKCAEIITDSICSKFGHR